MSGIKIGWVVTLCGLAVSAMPARAQEWTRFRGPNGTGISTATTVPATFTEKDFNWKVTLPGAGHSSPVLWGQKLFLTSADADTGKRFLLCLNATDGKQLWAKEFYFAKYGKHEFNSFASGTPAVDKERVYTIWPTPDSMQIVATDHNGRQVWSRSLGKWEVNHGGGTSPVVVGEMVIVTDEYEGEGCFIAGLDRKTGVTKWKVDRVRGKAASFATPMVYQPKDGPAELICSSTAHGITSLDPQSGKINWEAPGLFKMRCVSSPVLAGERIIQTTGEGGGSKYAVGVRPGSPAAAAAPKMELEWTRDVSYVTTPIFHDGLIFFWGDGGIVLCAKADTGEEVWKERVGGNWFGSPVCVNGKLYAMSATGELVVINASDKFELVCRVPLGEKSHSTPAVANGVMYLRTESHLISVGGKKAQ